MGGVVEMSNALMIKGDYQVARMQKSKTNYWHR